MYKIKVFEQGLHWAVLDQDNLEKQVEKWSKEHPNAVVLETHYQVHNGTQYICIAYDDMEYLSATSAEDIYLDEEFLVEE